ncbi:MAG: hypothetical protein JEZ07_19920 [Phycisphaerae bacterium]|nr:hypothetical protein [Phycisphaerae bacterium]
MKWIILALFAGVSFANVTIDSAKKFQVIEGYGQGNMEQSTPGWYHKYGKEGVKKILDTLYTLKDGGLGLNICRYPMPAADAPGHDHMRRLPKNANKPFEYEDGKFNWEGHEDVLWLGKGAAERGAIMWASWYGVPYWLSNSGCAAGSDDGGNNLIAGKEKRFIKHVTDVLEHFRDEWDIEFDYVCPINEPEADWWKTKGGQPGCGVSVDQAIILFNELHKSLKSKKYDAKLIGYDAAYTNSTTYLDAFLKGEMRNKIDVLSCHQYITEEKALKRWATRARLNKKSLWMTEWGDWKLVKKDNETQTKQMMLYANKLHEAFEVLQANAWIMWEPSFILMGEKEGLVKRKSYWAVAHYSRHVRPGFRRVEVRYGKADPKTTAWVDKDIKKMVIVSVNDSDKDVKVRYELKGKNPKVVEIRKTGSDKNYELSAEYELKGNVLEVDMKSQSVMTIEIEAK